VGSGVEEGSGAASSSADATPVSAADQCEGSA
jgi:hypothetical protein